MNRTLFSPSLHSALLPALFLGGLLLGGTAHAQDAADRVEALEQEVADLRARLATATVLIANGYLVEADFHAMDEALHQGDIDPRYLSTVREATAIVSALHWPAELQGLAEGFLAAADELAGALEAEDAAAAAEAAALVHDRQHELTHNIIAALANGHGAGAETEIPEGASRVLLELTERGGAAGGAETYSVRRGETVALIVLSAAAGELHLHGYDLEWDLEAGEEVTTVFEASSTGRYPLEFHPADGSRGVGVAYLEVHP